MWIQPALLAASLLAATASVPARAASPVCTYRFQDTLAADEPGMPALVSVDPGATNHFADATVFGQARRVFYFGGSPLPSTAQGGLTLAVPSPVPTNEYSAEMVFRFHDRAGAWRRILDVRERTSDNGFYVDPGNTLDIFPYSGSQATFVNNVYHHVVLTVAPDGRLRAFLDGVPQFDVVKPGEMFLSPASRLLGVFLDNAQGGGQGEWSQGDISLLRIHAGILTDAEIAALAGRQGPPLAIARAGDDVEMSWPALSSDYQLQSADRIGDAGAWKAVPGAPVPSGDRLKVVQTPSDAARFYRLARP